MAVALGLAVLGPALLHLGSRFLGIEEVDYYGTLWFYWFAAEHWADGLGWTDLFFYPWGKDILLHTGANVLDALVAAPLRWVFGPVLGFNLFLLGILLLDGWAMARVVRDLTRDPVARAAAAAALALSPFVLYELAEGRPTQALLGVLILALHQAWRLGERPTWRGAALTGVLLALTGYLYWYYALFGGLVALGMGLWRLARPAEGHTRGSTLLRYATAAALALVLTAPVAVPLVLGSTGGAVPGLLQVDAWTFNSMAPITEEGFEVALLSFQPLKGQSGFLILDEGELLFVGHQRLLSPVAALVLLLGLAWPGVRHRWPMVAGLALALLLATGPAVVVGSSWLPNPLYTALAWALPFVRRLWWPARSFVLVVPLVALCVALVLSRLGQRDRRLQLGLVVALVVGWGVHLRGSGLAPLPTWSATVPAGYRCLASGPPGAIIDLPWAWTQGHLYYQTAHGRPMLGGMLENNALLSPLEVRELMEDNTWLGALLAASGPGSRSEPWTLAHKEALGELGYRYVVHQKDAYYPHQDASPLRERRTLLREHRRALAALAGSPVYEDERTAIYAPWGDASPCEDQPVTPDATPAPTPSRTGTSSIKDLGTTTLSPFL